MIITKKALPRRTFLRGIGVTFALPLLDAMAPALTAVAKTPASPQKLRRLGYIYGFITVRKERRQRGGVYWSGYRRQGRRLRKHYLGRSAELTQARLAQAAALWETGAEPPS